MCEYPLEEAQWGNRIGDYFEGMACADIAGLHFVNIAIEKSSSQQLVQSFPSVIVHPNPAKDVIDAAVTLYKNCPKIGEYPYVYRGGWSQRLPKIGSLLLNAINKFYPDRRVKVLKKSDFADISFPVNKKAESVPFIPDAVIIFRCFDILLEYSQYGFLNFNVYQSLIPNNTNTIYVLSEPLNYMEDQDQSVKFRREVCRGLGFAIVAHLRLHFPNAVVAIRRGHPADSIAMLSSSKTVVCAPSTFCLWPGVVNTQSNNNQSIVYFAPGKVMRHQVYINDRFHWIFSPTFVRLDSLITQVQRLKLGKSEAITRSIYESSQLLSSPIPKVETRSI
jgi:hypothetical protein